MRNIELAKKAFPGILVEPEDGGKSITIDQFLRIDPCTIECKSIHGTVEKSGFEVTIDTGEDVIYVSKQPSFGEALTDAAVEHAKFRIRMLLQREQEDALACFFRDTRRFVSV